MNSFFKKDFSKYRNKRVEYEGNMFDSQAELDYYQYLKYLQSKWDVVKIELQPTYELQPKYETKNWEKIAAIKYKADFEVLYSNWFVDVVDVKWLPTETALMKRKVFMYKYPEKKLSWIIKFRWEWVDYFQNEQRKAENRKIKKSSKLPWF